MFKQSAKNLLEQPPEDFRKWLSSFDAVITDCDGVLWLSSNAIEGSVETINRFRALGKKVFFCTNNSSKTRPQLLEKAQQLGYEIAEEEIVAAAHSTAAYLKNRQFDRRVYVVGAQGITTELEAVGIEHAPIGPDVMPCPSEQYFAKHFQMEENIGAVVVGFDEHFSFPKLTKAASYLKDPGCLFVATDCGARFPMSNLVVPGTGSFVSAIATCAEREPLVIGKPNPAICERLIEEQLIEAHRTLMIGDQCNADILLGYNCGFQTLLVGTGIQKLSDAAVYLQSADPEVRKLIPYVFVPKLSDLLPFMQRVESVESVESVEGEYGTEGELE